MPKAVILSKGWEPGGRPAYLQPHRHHETRPLSFPPLPCFIFSITSPWFYLPLADAINCSIMSGPPLPQIRPSSSSSLS